MRSVRSSISLSLFAFPHGNGVLQLPSMTLDEAFETKQEMAEKVKDQVASSMKQFGIVVVQALMTDMQPDATVMEAMNRY